MKDLVGIIVALVLTGQDYRGPVLTTINIRFLSMVQEMVSEVLLLKSKGNQLSSC